MLVSLLLNTIDRFEYLTKCIGPALITTGLPPGSFELLVADNGSKDDRVAQYIQSLCPVWHRLNGENLGCAQMHNQMLLRAKGDYFCLLDDDTLIHKDGWLKQLVDTYKRIPQSGVIGIHSLMEYHAPEKLNGVVIHPARPPKEDAVFGTRLFGRTVLNSVGYFNETFSKYAYVDNCYNSRVFFSGFLNYYLDEVFAEHLCNDVGENSDYRRMKDKEMALGAPRFLEYMEQAKVANNYYVPPPVKTFGVEIVDLTRI